MGHSEFVPDEAAFLETLEQLVSIESPSHDVEAGNRLAGYLEARLKADGFEVRRVARQGVSDHLVASLDAGGDVSTLLLCHYDTVWPIGTISEMPLVRREGKLFGPGVQDMKGGIAIALHGVSLARLKGELAGKVTILITSDEETGSLTSRDLIEELARQHDRVLVLEPARDDGALKVARKGVGDYEVKFNGVSSHAGNSPELGASALRELSHFLIYAESLSEDGKGTTVNVTTARGGSVRNVIAERAACGIDFRVRKQSEADRVHESIMAYQPRDPRVKVTVEGGLNRPPLELTEANQALFDEVRQRASARLGLELEGAEVGGGSDGNFTSALGVPTLDGLGAVGAGPHARHEQVDIEATVGRVALLAAILRA